MVIPNSQLIVYDRDKIELIKKTICKGATDDELNLFIAECQRTGLDPFLKQIYSIPRRSRNPETGQWETRRETQTAIDGYRAIAERTGKYVGLLGPYWCGQDGQWIDIWLHKEPPEAAKVGVVREGFKEPIWAVALYAEYVQLIDGRPNRMWEKMPANQLGICAERQAYRKAFPRDMAGLVPTEDLVSNTEREPVVDGEPMKDVTPTGSGAPAARPPAAPAIPSSTIPPHQTPLSAPARPQPVAAPAANGKAKPPTAAEVAGAMVAELVQTKTAAAEINLVAVAAKVKALVDKRSREKPQPRETMDKAQALAAGKLDELLGGEEPRHILVAALFAVENGSLKSVTQPELFALLDWMRLDKMDDGNGNKVYLSTPDTDVFLREANAIIADYRLQHGQSQMAL